MTHFKQSTSNFPELLLNNSLRIYNLKSFVSIYLKERYFTDESLNVILDFLSCVKSQLLSLNLYQLKPQIIHWFPLDEKYNSQNDLYFIHEHPILSIKLGTWIVTKLDELNSSSLDSNINLILQLILIYILTLVSRGYDKQIEAYELYQKLVSDDDLYFGLQTCLPPRCLFDDQLPIKAQIQIQHFQEIYKTYVKSSYLNSNTSETVLFTGKFKVNYYTSLIVGTCIYFLQQYLNSNYIDLRPENIINLIMTNVNSDNPNVITIIKAIENNLWPNMMKYLYTL